jgi:hypothetical protein
LPIWPFHVQRGLEIPVAQQILVEDALVRCAGGEDGAVSRGELLGRQSQPDGGALDQDAARLGGGIAQRHAALFDAGAAGGAALIDGLSRVALDHPHGTGRQVQLLRDDLADGDVHALAGVHLAEEGDGGAVGL